MSKSARKSRKLFTEIWMGFVAASVVYNGGAWIYYTFLAASEDVTRGMAHLALGVAFAAHLRASWGRP